VRRIEQGFTNMRVMHTGDWHLGQTLRSFGREHEHREVLDQIVALTAVHRVDALIIAGDVFDSPNPSGSAQKLFYDTLVRLNRVRPKLTVVVTAGNHDAAGRLEAPRALLDHMNVRVVGNVQRTAAGIDAAHHLIDLPGPNGEIAAQVLAVSYPTAACLPVLPRVDGEAASHESVVGRLYAELMAATAARRRADLPLIVTGHLHVAGGHESAGAERRILIGGSHAVAPSVFPSDAAYVALGHLHKAQSIGRDSVRYAGSILPLSTTEQPYEHGVSLITFESCKVTAIEHVALKRPVAFLRVPERGGARVDALAAALKALNLDAARPVDWQPFVHVTLSRDDLQPSHRAEAERIIEQFPVRLADLRIEAASSAPALELTDPFVRLAERDPADLFRLAFERAHGKAPEPRHLDVFSRIAAGA
jgi:exonuclease SbcD